MAGPRLFDRVKETTTGTGTGNITLDGAQTGYLAFTDVLNDSDTTIYAIVEQAGADWEVGVGTFTASGTTLSRDTILASSNSGAAVNFGSGTKDVWINWPASAPAYLNPTDAYANLVAFASGRIAFPTDGSSLLRDSGSAFAPWGPIFPLTPPVDGDFSWVNQGSATVDATKGGIHLNDPANASLALRVRVKTAPATPYAITAAVVVHLVGTAGGGGLCFRESGTGELQTFSFDPTPFLNIQKWDSPTVFNSSYISRTFYNPWPLFMRIADDGANRICSLSQDGQNFLQVHSIGRTDFLTADQVGFFAVSNSASWNVGISVLSWKEE